MKNEILKPLEIEPSRGVRDRATPEHRLRPRDIEALRRMLSAGPLTIPQAYDCGHAESEAKGHGMNRLVAASLAVYCGWHQEEADALWMITERGKSALDARARRLLRPHP